MVIASILDAPKLFFLRDHNRITIIACGWISSSLIEAGKGYLPRIEGKNVDVPWGHQVQLCRIDHILCRCEIHIGVGVLKSKSYPTKFQGPNGNATLIIIYGTTLYAVRASLCTDTALLS